MKHLLLFFCLLLCISFTDGREILRLDENTKVVSGNNYVDYFLTRDSGVSPLERYEKMRHGEATNKVRRFLFVTTKSEKWLYLEAVNQLNTNFDMLLEMGNFGLQEIDYYVFVNDSLQTKGEISKRNGFHSSTFYDRNIIIPYTMQPGIQYAFLIKVKTNAPVLSLPIAIWNKKVKVERAQAMEMGRGLFYGVLIFFVVISGIVMYFVRNPSYIFYWLYISLGGALLFMKSGISLEILWPGHAFFDFTLRNFLLYGYLICTVLFLKAFLQKRMELGKIRKVINGFVICGIILTISYLPLSYLNKNWMDALLITQTVYTNATNILVTILFIYSFRKIKEKFLLSVSFAYYLIFSLYLFNPFVEFGFWISTSYGHIFIYSGGVFIAILLITITAIRTRIVFDHNQKMKRELSALNRSYTYSLLEGQEKERRRVAEELHDGIGVLLSTIKMKLSLLKDKTPDTQQPVLQAIVTNVDESCQHVRDLSHTLMPPALARFGLAPSLQDMLNDYQQQYGIQLSLKTNVSQAKMTNTSHIALYRLMHYLLEALVHAQCKKAEIKLYILPSVSNATLRVDYSGAYLHARQAEFRKLKEFIDLFQGRIDSFMSNVWDDELEIEIPIVMKDSH